MKTNLLKHATFLLVSTALSAASYGAAAAADNASDGAGFYTGVGGGIGFTPWQMYSNYASSGGNGNGTTGGLYIGTSQNNGNLDGNIDTSGSKSWGLWAKNGDIMSAVRGFTAGGINGTSMLGTGDQFKLTLDNGWISSPGSVGFGLQNSSGANRFEFYFHAGDSAYTINIGGTTFSTGIGWTSAGLSLDFTQGASNAWTLAVTPNGGSTSTFSNLSSGAVSLVASDISQVRAFNSNANANDDPGRGGRYDAFVNSLAVIPMEVPEPSSLVLLSFSAAGLLLRRRRS